VVTNSSATAANTTITILLTCLAPYKNYAVKFIELVELRLIKMK